MSKLCASCGKQVYPVEELKCSDQVYHKGCFRCVTCNLQLNLKNFKISEAKPYCTTHYPTQRAYTVVKDTPELDRVAKNMQVVSKVAYTGQLEKRQDDEMRRPPAEREIGIPPKPRAVGSIADYDPMSRQPAAAAQPARPPPQAAPQAQYQPPPQPQYQPPPQPQYQPPPQAQYQPPPQQQYQPPAAAAAPARSSGYGYGQPASSYNSEPQPQRQSFSQPEPEPQPQRSSFSQRDSYGAGGYDAGAGAGAGTGSAGGRNYRALYEYIASDADEVSFNEGDVIADGEAIDDGWMYGTVQRTGKRGMLPSNYVEPL